MWLVVACKLLLWNYSCDFGQLWYDVSWTFSVEGTHSWLVFACSSLFTPPIIPESASCVHHLKDWKLVRFELVDLSILWKDYSVLNFKLLVHAGQVNYFSLSCSASSSSLASWVCLVVTWCLTVGWCWMNDDMGLLEKSEWMGQCWAIIWMTVGVGIVSIGYRRNFFRGWP